MAPCQLCASWRMQVIMDGNARWAAQRGLSTFMGHKAGLEAFKKLVTCCKDWQVPALTVSTGYMHKHDGHGHTAWCCLMTCPSCGMSCMPIRSEVNACVMEWMSWNGCHYSSLVV